MGLSLQRKLELAGDLAKVQPLLIRLRLIEKPKQRRPVRRLVIVGSAVVAVSVVASVVVGRMRYRTGAPDGIQGFAHSGPDAETRDADAELTSAPQPEAEVTG